MHESHFEYDPRFDYRPLWGWVAIIAILQVLPWFGVECVFGWCVVQDDQWPVYTFVIALPAPFLLAAFFWLVRRVRVDND